MPSGRLTLAWRPFRFRLARPLHTACGVLQERCGWLLQLQEEREGRRGWGEVAPLELEGGQAEHRRCQRALAALGDSRERSELEPLLPSLPPALAFGLGAALAELDGLPAGAAGGIGWLEAPAAAGLLPAGAAMLPALEAWLAGTDPGSARPALKWKVAAAGAAEELRLLEQLLARLPAGVGLRLDANGGWDRATARAWAERLEHDPRLEWLEQPLDPTDQEGLEALAARLPVALDESLQRFPALRSRWQGWQVRRPSQEGDPRPLLAELERGVPRRMLSTGFETGIGRRWLHHLAALQAQGPTPAAPGLAPGWQPAGPLFAPDPLVAWASLAVAAEGEP